MALGSFANQKKKGETVGLVFSPCLTVVNKPNEKVGGTLSWVLVVMGLDCSECFKDMVNAGSI